MGMVWLNNFFYLNKRWKVWVYRLGFIGIGVGLLPVVLIYSNLHWGEDLLKKKDKYVKGFMQKFFYLFGFIIIIGIIFQFLIEVNLL
jgi:hypothetical protein